MNPSRDSASAPALFADLAMARRLERAEGAANARFVEARAKNSPGSGASWIDVGGTYAMFDTPTSPATQTFGLGLFNKALAVDLERIEAFFRERGAPTYHEVSPLAGPEVIALLHERGYHVFELTSVLVRPVDMTFASAPENPRLTVRGIERGEEERFADLSARGWSENAEVAGFVRAFGLIGARRANTYSFFAEWDGVPIATGSLSLEGGVAVLAGASTVPEARQRGAQWALLDARLRLAARQGCELASMGALPGSASQRNAERHGFRVVYTRLKWRQPVSST